MPLAPVSRSSSSFSSFPSPAPAPAGSRGRPPAAASSGTRWRRPLAGPCWAWRCGSARPPGRASRRGSVGPGRLRRRTFGITTMRIWPGCWSSGRCGEGLGARSVREEGRREGWMLGGFRAAGVGLCLLRGHRRAERVPWVLSSARAPPAALCPTPPAPTPGWGTTPAAEARRRCDASDWQR